MATLLEGIRDVHEGPEPRVKAEDVQAILKRVIRPGDDDGGRSVSLVAERAGVSTRTVYRVLQGDKSSLGLALADALVLAAGSHLAACRLVWNAGKPDEYETPYVSV